MNLSGFGGNFLEEYDGMMLPFSLKDSGVESQG